MLAGGWEPSHIALRPAETLAALDADLLLGTRAVHLDAAERTVTTADGRCLRADAIVIATGAAPRTIPSHEPLTGVHMLRTMDDALGLSAALRDHRRLVVVGDGVLGMEAAATARLRGVSVTVIGAQAAPMSAQLGPLVADFVADLHHQQGVEVLSGVNVGGLNHRDGRVTAMAIEDGPVLDTDLVLVAIGARPTTDWLNGSGLILDDGVVCNAACAAADGIYAVGDVARWYHEGLGRHLRLENRTNASEQAITVAENLLGGQRTYTPVPYFWTDQYDTKITVHGLPSPTDQITVVEGGLAQRASSHEHRQGHTATALVGWNMPRQTVRQRRRIVATYTAADPTTADAA